MSNSNPEALFLAIGLESKFVAQTLKNQKVTQSLLEVLQSAKLTQADKKTGALLYSLATTLPDYLLSFRAFLAGYIASNSISSQAQLGLAFNHLKEVTTSKQELDVKNFEKSVGIGIKVTSEEIDSKILELFDERKAELTEKRYTINMGDYMTKLRERLPFADGALLNQNFQKKLGELLGPVTEADLKMKEEAKKKKPAAIPTKPAEEKKEKEIAAPEEEDTRDKLKKLMARDLGSSLNSAEILRKHKELVGDKVYTRFPPEPNGYLHIGHAKAMRFNFLSAKESNGHCYLRFDDTNPDKENKEYIENIKKNVEWLGYQPFKITHASDNFQQLYDFALVLIAKDKAFVCHQTKSEINESRKNLTPSPYRNRPIEESLKLFEQMKMGLFEEGKAMLRLKIDYKHVNPTMRDPVAYRIKYAPHPHAGDKWCIYPMYDYTHCICDSLENITHSLCTLEFEVRRDLYYWVLEQLELYRPFVWEYSRLNISNTVLSKRKLHRLVFENKVNGWDDPRILTLNGLRRRGFTPEAINDFCDLISVTRRGNENILSYSLLEHCIRKDLDNKAQRTMAVLDPVPLKLTNLKSTQSYSAPDFPKDPSKGTHQVLLTSDLYVDRSDVRLVDSPDFFGIAPGKLVGLKYAVVIKITKIIENAEGIEKIEAEVVEEGKPKSFLHWISKEETIDCEVRVYDLLFKVHDPNELEDYLTAFNKDSLKIMSKAKINKNLKHLKVEDKVQFERIGFFVVDRDSNVEEGRFVFNKTVSLQDKEKQKTCGGN